MTLVTSYRGNLLHDKIMFWFVASYDILAVLIVVFSPAQKCLSTEPNSQTHGQGCLGILLCNKLGINKVKIKSIFLAKYSRMQSGKALASLYFQDTVDEPDV